tara:strand:- start:3076 stop:3288 length:213 start_codon:yes stop_codon:yes gene_type:complete
MGEQRVGVGAGFEAEQVDFQDLFDGELRSCLWERRGGAHGGVRLWCVWPAKKECALLDKEGSRIWRGLAW